MKSGNKELYFAEVVEANIFSWKAVCWRWNDLPDYGSIVVIEQDNCSYFGLVSSVETGSRDSFRVPFAYQKSFEELAKEQPQIFQLLQSSFLLVPLGYKTNKGVFHILPAKLPLIHSFVRRVDVGELKEFVQEFGFLDLVFNSDAKYIDELVVCLVRFFSESGILNQNILTKFFEKLSAFSGSDYRKFNLIAQRTEKIISA